ncbi:hypothetical protein [Corynebacterium sp. LK2510]|uniref:hypothetical protein n=1 Tax=Corynebacterium sp. LK2510 TaxID=3110472 RepID=UPI0034CDCF09
MTFRYRSALIALPLAAATLAACSPAETGQTSQTSVQASATETTTAAEAHEGEKTQVSSLSPRVVFAREGGLTTIDPATGEVIDEVARKGFLRLSSAGDGRHVMLVDGDAFRTFDSGLITDGHGDHNHYYEQAPALLDTTYTAPEAGHVVAHDGLTALFSDGTGEVTILKSEDIADPNAQTTTFSTGEAHHGVAVALEDGSVVHTVGTEDERHTIRHTSAEGTTLAETTNCPGIHGEAAAAGGALVFGCTNGPVIFKNGEFVKLPSEGYQRNGNLVGDEESPIVLGDNKVDEDAEHERPTTVILIDTENESTRFVELGSSYWFRSLGRGPRGEALVLTYDGNLAVIDQNTGEITNRIPVIAPWEEKEEWQEPGPILKVHEGIAYVTDAENRELVTVDLFNGVVENRQKLSFAPVEMEIVG